MNIQHLKVEITPATRLDPKTYSECRIEVVADGQRFAYVEVISRDEFTPYFERLMDYARATIIVAVKDHQHGIKSPKGRRSRKDS